MSGSKFWARGRDRAQEGETVEGGLAGALTAMDRCDRCGAQAYVQALLPNGLELLFCAHHSLQLTKAGAVLLDASRTVLSLVDHEVNRTRQAAGLGRQRLRVVVPPRLPDALAVEAALRHNQRSKLDRYRRAGAPLPACRARRGENI